jgi:hypothetical protein
MEENEGKGTDPSSIEQLVTYKIGELIDKGTKQSSIEIPYQCSERDSPILLALVGSGSGGVGRDLALHLSFIIDLLVCTRPMGWRGVMP